MGREKWEAEKRWSKSEQREAERMAVNNFTENSHQREGRAKELQRRWGMERVGEAGIGVGKTGQSDEKADEVTRKRPAHKTTNLAGNDSAESNRERSD